MVVKTCSNCKEDKPVSNFSKCSAKKDGFKNQCKACAEHKKQYDAKRYQQNRESIKKRVKAYTQANPESRKRTVQKWCAQNKEKKKPKYRQKYRQKYRRERYASDPLYKLKCLLRGRLHAALNGKSKAESTLKLLGCPLLVFQEHLEAQFTNEMTWENMGMYWHIDHIVPFAAFDLANHLEQRVVCWYPNLQPLPGVDNLTKGANYREEDKEDLIRRYNEEN